MHNRASLINDMQNLGISNDGTLFVHSSMKKIGNVSNGADEVLDALMEYMKDGTLILPTHSWASIKKENCTFDVAKTPSCVGILTELFRKRPFVVRTLHPTHSVAVIGKDSKKFTVGDENYTTPCSRNSIYGKLYDYKAQILFIGVDLTKATFIHGIEEWAEIPDRLSDEDVILYVRDYNNKILTVPSKYHIGSKSRYYGRATDLLLKYGCIKKGTFGDAESMLVDAYKSTELLMKKLKLNPKFFVDENISPEDFTL